MFVTVSAARTITHTWTRCGQCDEIAVRDVVCFPKKTRSAALSCYFKDFAVKRPPGPELFQFSPCEKKAHLEIVERRFSTRSHVKYLFKASLQTSRKKKKNECFSWNTFCHKQYMNY